jgi:hypothetical protein
MWQALKWSALAFTSTPLLRSADANRSISLDQDGAPAANENADPTKQTQRLLATACANPWSIPSVIGVDGIGKNGQKPKVLRFFLS